MRVAQFGFDEEIDTAIHHPANYPTDVVAYTGTHDNDTTVGWFWGDNQRHDRRRLDRNRRRLLALTGTRGEEINWDLIKIVLELRRRDRGGAGPGPSRSRQRGQDEHPRARGGQLDLANDRAALARNSSSGSSAGDRRRPTVTADGERLDAV